MDQTPRLVNPARTVRILHGALLAGLVLVGATFALMLRLGHSQSFPSAPTIGLVLAGLGVILLAVAATVLRPRLPEGRPDQSAVAYWAAADTRGSAIVLWSVVQAAGLIALIGYLLTGAIVPLTVGALALATLFLLRPSRLEGDGAA